jgi:hypothetical protein
MPARFHRLFPVSQCWCKLKLKFELKVEDKEQRLTHQKKAASPFFDENHTRLLHITVAGKGNEDGDQGVNIPPSIKGDATSDFEALG